jgi:hypothetical protein
MTTRGEINTLIRRRLQDQTAPNTFTDEQINQWINDAIEEYSRYFPRIKTQEIGIELDPGEAASRKHDLNYDFRGVISVEYPNGEDPPIYLERRDYRHPDFWLVDGYYDVVQRGDAGNADELWISQTPADKETIAVEYLGDHDMLDSDTGTTSVPDTHLEIILLHARWSALQALASGEAANPDPNNVLLDRYEAIVSRAERAYYRKVEELRKVEADSAAQPWSMDKWDRVY